MSWRIGIDVGGTFTDLFAVNEHNGETRTAKVLSTRHRLVESVLGALKQTGIKAAEVTEIVHGSTTATNALIERSFPTAAMITTEGFRDTIERYEHRPSGSGLAWCGVSLDCRTLADLWGTNPTNFRERRFTGASWMLGFT